MNLVVFGDSKAMARGRAFGSIPYSDTYPHLLAERLSARWGKNAPLLIDRARRSSSIETVIKNWPSDVLYRQPSAIILQVGGSDCYPRVFLPHEREWIERIPVGRIRDTVFQWERDHREPLLRLLPNRRIVPPIKYRRRLHWIAKETARTQTPLLLLPVIPLSARRMAQLPRAAENMKIYNEMHAQCAALFPHVRLAHLAALRRPYLPDEFTPDGMHLNRAGAMRVAEELERILADALPALS